MRPFLFLSLVLVVACKKKPDDETIDGTWQLVPAQAAEGDCGTQLARLYFGTGGPWSVELEDKGSTLHLEDSVRLGLWEGSGVHDLSFDGEAFNGDLFNGDQDQGTLDASVHAFAEVNGAFDDLESLQGLWTLDADCTGFDCEQVSDNYETPFPCTFTQLFSGTKG